MVPERWVTLQQVCRCAIDPELFAAKLHDFVLPNYSPESPVAWIFEPAFSIWWLTSRPSSGLERLYS